MIWVMHQSVHPITLFDSGIFNVDFVEDSPNGSLHTVGVITIDTVHMDFDTIFIDVFANVLFSGIAHIDDMADFTFIDVFDSNPVPFSQVSPYRSTRSGRVSSVCSARMERLPANVQMYVLVPVKRGIEACLCWAGWVGGSPFAVSASEASALARDFVGGFMMSAWVLCSGRHYRRQPNSSDT